MQYPPFFSSVGQEITALKKGIVYKKWETVLMSLHGKDCQKLLHAITTNDIESLKPFSQIEFSFLQANGKMIVPSRALVLNDAVLLEVPENHFQKLAAHLDKYIIMEDVVVSPEPSALKEYAFHGDNVAEKISALFPGWQKPVGNQVLAYQEDLFFTYAQNLYGPEPKYEGYVLCLPEAMEQKLFQRAMEVGIMPAGFESIQALEVLYALPRFEADYHDAHLPLEVGLKKNISFTKGCYLGQEIIARVDTQSHVVKNLVQLVWDEPIDIAPGTELFQEGEPGSVGYTTRSISDGVKTYSLAMVKWPAIQKSKTVMANHKPGHIHKIL
jgi:folate-binding protein YgfZ